MKENFGQILKQASELQAQMKQVQHEMDNQVVIGASGGGLVKIQMNGRHDVSNVTVDDSLLEDKEVLQDLVAAAINNAVQKIDEAHQKKIADLTGGFSLPFSNWPM